MGRRGSNRVLRPQFVALMTHQRVSRKPHGRCGSSGSGRCGSPCSLSSADAILIALPARPNLGMRASVSRLPCPPDAFTSGRVKKTRFAIHPSRLRARGPSHMQSACPSPSHPRDHCGQRAFSRRSAGLERIEESLTPMICQRVRLSALSTPRPYRYGEFSSAVGRTGGLQKSP